MNWAIKDKNETNQGDLATAGVVGIALGVAVVGIITYIAAFGIWSIFQGGQKGVKTGTLNIASYTLVDL